jgi:hypothetical protein
MSLPSSRSARSSTWPCRLASTTASPAFIRELLRRAALVAAVETEGALRVTGEHLQRALAELRAGAEELTKTLLGARPRPD